jgi:predicted acyltransferase
MVFGFIAVTVGYVWGLTFPVNKNLWSSSFVLVTSGLASLLLGTLYYIVDIRNYTSGTKPGIIFGANAIAIYFISDIIAIFFYSTKFGAASLNQHFMQTFTSAGLDPKLVSMLYAIIFVFINFGIAYILYRKKIFIKL